MSKRVTVGNVLFALIRARRLRSTMPADEAERVVRQWGRNRGWSMGTTRAAVEAARAWVEAQQAAVAEFRAVRDRYGVVAVSGQVTPVGKGG